ncbi:MULTISPECIES: enhanced entry protein EnhB [Legionella]|uniref:Enhanced entry protein EnhB n=1 Tax=Legionella septentrionalis TaxID=2498109 RepID=A0A3S0XSB4_9GAMM|nr:MULTISPECIES: enhanced entry protein EnhB [Legionella]MCP0913266.1 enhanced entry protein EnhB [Legionella sp. 27cVA30]RUQ82081.1 enhanced entry protein EnhB [Legionella septentrionalis]RUQ95540.1 enhanced entry protein EnhB [Legionella septentrionalis]RUR08939.1 enhanced entry protein EnhB [Legionella septentrionalis]RUR14724.1 enhanced entry protein EnhB [Legionella septentrionalis]
MGNNINKIFVSFLILLSFNDIGFAATFPHGCEVTGFGFNTNYLVLNEKGDQTFYLIQNRSNMQIELERYEIRDVFMSPKLQSKIDAQNWSAFASDVQNLHFKCYAHQDANNTSLVNCSDVLEVCQYPRVKFALSNMGNYWVSTNKPQNQVIKDAAAKGILLRW